MRAGKAATLQLGGRASSLPEIGPVGAELDIEADVPLDYDEFMATLDRNFPGGVMEAALTFETSRGCWWGERAHCTFCGLNSDAMGYRSMSPERALALIRSLFKYAARTRRLECVDNIMPKSYMRDVFPHLETPEGMTIFYEVKADLSDADLAALSRARVRSLQPGIEALATSTLRLMKKGTSALGNLRFLKDCLRHDVYPEWNLLVGFPGEEEAVYETYDRDLPLYAHLPPPSGVYPVRFDRFSPYFTHAAEYGLDLHPYEFYAMVYPFPAASLGNLAYYFIDRNFSAEYVTRTARWLGRLRTRVDAWRERWHRAPGGIVPRLFLVETAAGSHVYDSRTGEIREHPLTDRRPPAAGSARHGGHRRAARGRVGPHGGRDRRGDRVAPGARPRRRRRRTPDEPCLPNRTRAHGAAAGSRHGRRRAGPRAAGAHRPSRPALGPDGHLGRVGRMTAGGCTSD